jgi:hypothetical protein
MKTEQSLRKTPVEPIATLPGHLGAAGIGATVDLRMPSRAAGIGTVYADVPPSVYGTFIACWTALIAVFWFTFAESPNAAFMVAISTAFGIMFFGVPIVMNRLGYRQPWSGPGLADFLRGKVQTLTGSVNGFDAFVQITVVPVCLTIGAVMISFIIDLDRFPYVLH